MEYIVKIHKKNKVVEKKTASDTNLLKFLRKNSIQVNAACNGNGTCGKCKVVVHGLVGDPQSKESKLLGKSALEKGYRLACYSKIDANIDIYMEESEKKAKIVVEGKENDIQIVPVIHKDFLNMDPPGIEDQKSDIDRILNASKMDKINNSVSLLSKLPEMIRNSNYQLTLVSMDKRIIGIEEGDTRQKLYGMAFDIGTTTIAAYLIDLITGKRIGTASKLNPQSKFGADIISRIQYTIDSPKALKDMNRLIIDAVNGLVSGLVKKNHIKREDVYLVSLVGNTTMMHFLMNIPAKNIAVSPFIPVTTRTYKMNAKELGILINPWGQALIYPSLSGYIGADTIAAVLSSGIEDNKKISLLIDIGTNGEIVLGNSKWLYACSTAAGPAFEGANIRNGVGGIVGAIDKVTFTPRFNLSTIGDESAIGICGSGIVDLVAGMLSVGILDESGRIKEKNEIKKLKTDMRNRLITMEGMKAFMICKEKECAAGSDIVITQKDIREVQNAKAAISAGIKILVKEAGIEINDIDKVYLAGGFGSYINIESALTIGLISKELHGKVESIGNSAGIGAIQGLISTKKLKETEEIKKKMKYIELSTSEDFMDEYINCMGFEGFLQFI